MAHRTIVSDTLAPILPLEQHKQGAMGYLGTFSSGAIMPQLCWPVSKKKRILVTTSHLGNVYTALLIWDTGGVPK